MLERRAFIQQSAAAVGASLGAPGLATLAFGAYRDRGAPTGFIDLLRGPDSVIAQTANGDLRLASGANGNWDGPGVQLRTTHMPGALRVELAASSAQVKRIGLRWRGRLDDVRAILGDAWERGYGDFAWRGFEPDRVMPWYVATSDGKRAHTYGVRTGASALCFWYVDPDGLSLWADVRSGAAPLELGSRVLHVCDVMSRAGRDGESAFAATHAFCKQLCASPRLPAAPVYGSNDWYYAYGKNSSATALADADHIVELSPTGPNRPYAVIDDGWQPGRGASRDGAGRWDRANEKFPTCRACSAT